MDVERRLLNYRLSHVELTDFFVVIVMSKRLRMDERNNDGKPDEVKVSRPVWGEE